MKNKTITLILGDQLFSKHPAINTDTDYLMIENPIDCSPQKNLHKQKIIFFLASMRNYATWLENEFNNDQKMYYFYLYQEYSFEEKIIAISKEYQIIQFCKISDKGFSQKIINLCKKYFTQIIILPNPSFLTTSEEFGEYLEQKTAKKLIMADFYIWQRERLNILIENSKPLGGKWSFDKENRKKLPKNYIYKERYQCKDNKTWENVKLEVEKYLPNSLGKADICYLATTFDEVNIILNDFLDNFLLDFGTYQDAMTTSSNWVNHSILSPYLNNGLITPQEILDILKLKIINHPELLNNRLASIEGYIRQLIGWREWIKAMYDTQYSNNICDYNFFQANKPLPRYFWFEGLEQLENIPLRDVLLKVQDYGYAHHIERLMILANYMTLSGYNPQECLDWFSSMFVDALDWVMVPNVIGMGLFADGGIFATKPYVSSSNYILKMSNYPKGEWQKEWDSLFWIFLLKNDEFFESNPRMSMLIKTYKKKST